MKKQKKVKVGDELYTITDKHHGDLIVTFSHNAWWIERGKVEALIAAFKMDAKVEEACIYAGITVDQYKYFLEKHKDFSAVKEACKNLPVLKARKTAIDKLSDSYSNAIDYLERKRPDEFSKTKKVQVEVADLAGKAKALHDEFLNSDEDGGE